MRRRIDPSTRFCSTEAVFCECVCVHCFRNREKKRGGGGRRGGRGLNGGSVAIPCSRMIIHSYRIENVVSDLFGIQLLQALNRPENDLKERVHILARSCVHSAVLVCDELFSICAVFEERSRSWY